MSVEASTYVMASALIAACHSAECAPPPAGAGGSILGEASSSPDEKRTVSVYRNLHTGTWSEKDHTSGLVIGHPKSIILADVKFVVGEKSRQRVMKEKSKNVHAFVRGHRAKFKMGKYEKVSYNPYKAGAFTKEDGTEVHSAKLVVMTPKGVFALGAE